MAKKKEKNVTFSGDLYDALNDHQKYGFSDGSKMAREALEMFCNPEQMIRNYLTSRGVKLEVINALEEGKYKLDEIITDGFINHSNKMLSNDTRLRLYNTFLKMKEDGKPITKNRLRYQGGVKALYNTSTVMSFYDAYSEEIEAHNATL
jgi:hypothetical protein